MPLFVGAPSVHSHRGEGHCKCSRHECRPSLLPLRPSHSPGPPPVPRVTLQSRGRFRDWGWASAPGRGGTRGLGAARRQGRVPEGVREMGRQREGAGTQARPEPQAWGAGGRRGRKAAGREGGAPGGRGRARRGRSSGGGHVKGPEAAAAAAAAASLAAPSAGWCWRRRRRPWWRRCRWRQREGVLWRQRRRRPRVV